MRKPLRAASIAFATALVALVGAEIALRVFRPVEHLAPLDAVELTPGVTRFHQRAEVPGLPYELVPGARGAYLGVEVSINALGQRGAEVERAKPPGTYRVVALGDSLTFGYGAPDEGTWPAALERVLNADPAFGPSRPVQVLNLGVSGYNTANEAVALEAKALDLDPDVIVVGYFLNDPQIAPLSPLQRWFRTPAWWEHSHLLRLASSWSLARAKARFGGDSYRYLHDPDGEGWAMVVRAFESMHRAASARGIPVVVATLPAFPPTPDWKDYRWHDLHERVLAAATASGLLAIDTLPEFLADGRRPKDLCVDFEHPNAAGAEILARAVAAEIRRIAAHAPADSAPR
ncbi:MAG: GDSL-type esterase/lipase family protein [Planctomycetota bacterium]|nr:GDSL-type esterase/lipase family protein [Planctomycetota bacterium]